MILKKAALLSAVLFPALAWGGSFNSTGKGTTSAGFLKVGAGARAAGMGEAYSAVADEADALYWNPGALTRVEKRSVTLMHVAGLDASSFDYGAYAQSLGNFGAFAVGFQYASAPELIETDDATGADVGTFKPNDLAVSAGYAYRLLGFSLGIAGKFIRSQIIDSDETGAADFGVLSPALRGGRLRFAFTAANLGGRLKFERESARLPFALRMGSSYEILDDWTAALDVGLPIDDDPYVALGTECALPLGAHRRLTGRMGFNSHTVGDVSGLTGFSTGLGLGFQRWTADYALIPFGGLGLTHRVSLSIAWGTAKVPPPASPTAQTKQTAPVKQTEPAQRLVSFTTPERQFALATEMLDQKNLEQAKEELEEAAGLLSQDDPRRIVYYERMGTVLYLIGDLTAAEDFYTRAILAAAESGFKGPQAADAYMGMGLCLVAESDYAEAIKHFLKGLEAGPSPKTRKFLKKQIKELQAR